MTMLISAKNLCKSFGYNHALASVNFNIIKGEPVALVGPNGAGKTTLFSILCGYIQPSSGQVSIFGHHPGSKELFGRVAALPQDAQLDPRFSIAHQLKFYAQLQGFSPRQSQNEAERTLDLVGLKDVLKVKPSELSHGMRKRVTIAQALIGSPEIVLLDEATAGLDPLHAREVREIVSSLANKVTFILSSHDLNELERLCSQVLYLEGGKLQEHQTLTIGSVDTKLRFLTLRMKHQVDGLMAALQQLASITQVELTQDKEYLISANVNNPLVEVEILKVLHQNHWQYSQLVNGKTLENQLF